MSLIVWLPLNGDLKNQGLSGINGNSLGTINWVDGKIGKALYAGNGSQVENGISYNSNLISELGSEFSASIWVYPKGNHVHYNGTFLSSGNWNNQCWSFGVSQDNTHVDIFGAGYNHYIACSVPINAWTHLACSHKNGVTKLYKNGVYVGEISGEANALVSDASNFCVGRETYAGGYFSFNGYLNDVRIYNHALSAKEVKEISKGLVLHFPFREPYIENTTNISSQTSKDGWNNSGTAIRETNNVSLIENAPYPDNVYSIKVTTAGNCALTFGNSTINVTSKTVTCSVYCYLSGTQDSNSVYIRSSASDGSLGSFTYNGSSNPTTWPKDTWIRLEKTITASSSETTIYFCTYANVLNNIRAFCGWQIEEKNYATPFTKTSRNEDIIYDCSGYGYNGIKFGTIICNSNSPRYKISYKFDGNSCIKNNKFYFNSSIWTVSLWYKYNTVPTSYEGLICLSKNDGSDSNKKFAIMPNSNHIWFKAENSSISIPSLKIGEWCHLAIVSNGTSAIVYENGIQKGTTTISSFIEGAYDLVIGARASSSGAETTSFYSKGNISDVRIYTTALSANDIKELYNTSLIIDNSGKIYTYEYVENS